MDKQFFKAFKNDKNLIAAFLCFFAIVALNTVLFKGFLISFTFEIIMFLLAALLLTYCVFKADEKHRMAVVLLSFITAIGISPLKDSVKTSSGLDKPIMFLTIIIIISVAFIHSKSLFVFPLVAATVFLYFYPVFFILLLPLFMLFISVFIGKQGLVPRVLSVSLCVLFSLIFFMFFEIHTYDKVIKIPDKYILLNVLSVLPFLVLAILMWIAMFRKTNDKSIKATAVVAISFPMFVLAQSLFYGRPISPANWIVLVDIGLILRLFTLGDTHAVDVVKGTFCFFKKNIIPVSLAFLFAYAVRSHYLFIHF